MPVDAKAIGNSAIAQVTATALSNLMVAVGKGEPANVCVVLSGLTGSQKSAGGN